MPELTVAIERWPIAGGFTIARGTRTEAVVVVATLTDGAIVGRGEAVPYARYGETVDGVVADIEGLRAHLAAGLDRRAVHDRMPAGAARNALDAALWDLEAKRTGRRVWDLAGVAPPPAALVTAETLSIAAPEAMAEKARALADRPLLKVKVGAEDPLARIAAVRAGAPESALIVDANEAWTPDQLRALLPELARLRVDLLEQPLPADRDGALAGLESPVTLCADESAHVSADVPRLAALYGAVNVKLDKTGGLTEALDMVAAARAHGLRVMVGCMVGTSLAMAPATVVAGAADFVDLDGPVLLARDRDPGIAYHRGRMEPPPAALWG
ncbi:N-acetyl-D-Glu racemase DgcA [Roseospira goensis]|uniref:Dipeptide epimerase n=1 Tax=Roseospira goensis TaxID=391922 RepID=A0A7W6WJW5_9PROT|nr:N-acetyl-D-Glu racemase DgcA [Roseospira goensis]MBB4285074.1 L-alanine-DL-glutamate epimerase-like enolase superfamily enzyme [Roseospira goensis]